MTSVTDERSLNDGWPDQSTIDKDALDDDDVYDEYYREAHRNWCWISRNPDTDTFNGWCIADDLAVNTEELSDISEVRLAYWTDD